MTDKEGHKNDNIFVTSNVSVICLAHTILKVHTLDYVPNAIIVNINNVPNEHVRGTALFFF